MLWGLIRGNNVPFFPKQTDPQNPFIMRNGSDLETIYITDSDTHIEVPCLVSDPDLKVSLFLVGPTAARFLENG